MATSSADALTAAMGAVRFWGATPAVDMSKDAEDIGATYTAVLAYTGDVHHALCTLSALQQSAASKSENAELVVYVVESSIETLARHLLALSIALDKSLSVIDRAETWLEIYGNIFVRERTHLYLADRALPDIVDCVGFERGALYASHAVDLSLLKHKEKDELEDVVRAWGKPIEKEDDERKLGMLTWTERQRHYYKERFDHRENVVDWDYQMKWKEMQKWSDMVHYKQFRRWRLDGIAFERTFMDSNFSNMNTTMWSFSEKRRDAVSTKGGYRGDVCSPPFCAVGMTDLPTHMASLRTKLPDRPGQDFGYEKTVQDVAELCVARWFSAFSGDADPSESLKAPSEGEDKKTSPSSPRVSEVSEEKSPLENVDDGGAGSVTVNVVKDHVEEHSKSTSWKLRIVPVLSPEVSRAELPRPLAKSALKGKFSAAVIGHPAIHWLKEGVVDSLLHAGGVAYVEGILSVLEVRPPQQVAYCQRLFELIDDRFEGIRPQAASDVSEKSRSEYPILSFRRK